MVLPNWASFDRQQSFNYFCSALPKVAKAIKWSDDGFNAWNKCEDPEKSMPAACQKLTRFQKLLVILVFRPEKVQKSLINFVCDALGISNISGHNQSIKNMAEK